MTLRVGTICFATEQGIGRLAKALFDHRIITHPVVIRHPKHQNHPEWYKGHPAIHSVPAARQALELLLPRLDACLFIELPFDWSLLTLCRQRGVRTILCTMYEVTPERLLAGGMPEPDLYLCPSLLDLQVFSDRKTPAVYLPVPVEVPWRLRTRAEHFVHHAGHGSYRDRNGTALLLQALPHIQSPIRLTVRAQDAGVIERALAIAPGAAKDRRVTFQLGTVPYEKLWADGDAFVFCESWNGLSLPLQEARAAGMLVIAGDRYPMHTWLPREPLVPVESYRKARIGPPYLEVQEAHYDPRDVAAKIDWYFGRDITDYSRAGKAWAESMSWAQWGSQYLEVLKGL